MADGAVIWEGSPLHQYLEAAGVEDVDVTARLKNIQPDEDGTGPSFLQTVVSLGSAAKDVLLQGIFGASVDISWINDYTRTFLASALISEEDYSNVTLVNRSMRTKDSTDSEGSGTDGERTNSPLPSASVALGCVFSSGLLLLRGRSIPYTRILAAVILVPGLIAGNQLALASLSRHKHKRNRSIVESFLASQQGLVSNIGRTLRLIQEVELVFRGYNVGKVLSPIARMEQVSKDRKCMALRVLALKAMVINISLLRRTTSDLMKHYPLSITVDNPSFYLSVATPESLNICTSLKLADMLNQTQNCSLESLKMHNHLMKQLLSELLRRLCLTFSPETSTLTCNEVAADSLAAELEEAEVTSDDPVDTKSNHKRLFMCLGDVLSRLTLVGELLQPSLLQQLSFHTVKDDGITISVDAKKSSRLSDSAAELVLDVGYQYQTVLAMLHLCTHELREGEWIEEAQRKERQRNVFSLVHRIIDASNGAAEQLAASIPRLETAFGIEPEAQSSGSAPVDQLTAKDETFKTSEGVLLNDPSGNPLDGSEEQGVFEAYTGPKATDDPHEPGISDDERHRRWQKQREIRRLEREARLEQEAAERAELEIAGKLMKELNAVIQANPDV